MHHNIANLIGFFVPRDQSDGHDIRMSRVVNTGLYAVVQCHTVRSCDIAILLIYATEQEMYEINFFGGGRNW